jgi:hypothetical protein
LLITWLDCTKSCVSISKDAPNHAGGLQDVVVSCWGAQDVVVDVGSLVVTVGGGTHYAMCY